MHRRNPPRSGDVIRASCTTIEVVGRAVFISGPKVGQLYQVRLADPYDDSEMPSRGVVIKKVSGTECFVQLGGIVRDVFTTLDSGKTYKVGENGTVVRTPPLPGPLGYSMIQFIGVALSEDELELSTTGFMTRRKV